LFENDVLFSQYLSLTGFTVQTIMPVNAWKANSFIFKDLSGFKMHSKCMGNKGKCMKSHLWAGFTIKRFCKKRRSKDRLKF